MSGSHCENCLSLRLRLLTLLCIIIDFYSRSKFVTTFAQITIYHADTLKRNMRVTVTFPSANICLTAAVQSSSTFLISL